MIGVRALVRRVLTGVAKVRDHRGDAAGRGTAQSVGHDQQFHQVVIGRVGGRLDDEHVFAADVVVDFDEDFGVVETLHTGVDQIHRGAPVHGHAPRNRVGKRFVGIASDQFGFENVGHSAEVPRWLW